MTRARVPFLLLLIGCIVLLADQFLFAHEELSVHLDQKDLIERHTTLGRNKWSGGRRPAHRWSAWRAGAAWRVAHLENGRWFQLDDHDNGLLQHGDSVRVEVAPLTGRVLRFQRLARGVNKVRVSGDAYEDLVPFPAVLAGLCIWLLLARPGSDASIYLRGTIIVVSLVFLIALFAMSWPLMRALDWA